MQRGSIRHPRFPLAFAVASTSGAVGGILRHGGSVLGTANLQVILSIVFAGGVLGGLLCGRGFHERSWLVLAFLVLAALLVPLTSAYVSLRGGSIIMVELAIPMALAFVPFVFVYGFIVRRHSDT